MNIYTSKLISKKQLTSDVITLHFEKPQNFFYLAGQFIQWHLPEENGKVLLRSYSLSSAPPDETLEFCVKLLPKGRGSAFAQTIQPGEHLNFQGPRGLFVNHESPRPIYMVATGVGIAPLMGIIRDELENKKTDAEIRLLFGVRSEDDVFWHDRLEVLKEQFLNFSYHITLSQAKPNGGWGGLRGRVTEHILHHLVDHHFFLCGNAAMVKDVRDFLLKNGIDTTRIHFEIF